MTIDPGLIEELHRIAALLYPDNPHHYGPTQHQFDTHSADVFFTSRFYSAHYAGRSNSKHWGIVLVAAGLQPAPYGVARSASVNLPARLTGHEIARGRAEWRLPDLGGRRSLACGMPAIKRIRRLPVWDCSLRTYVPGPERTFYEFR